MKFYPHHISDFNNSTRHLTRVERSVYRDAIELYYDTEEALSSDLTRLSKRLLCFDDTEKEALNSVLGEFFTLTDAGYIHIRCDIEIERYRANSSAKARAGKASAEARKLKKAKAKEQKLTSVEQVLNTSSTEREQNSTNQEPLTKNQEPITNTKDKPRSRFTAPLLPEVIEYFQSKLSTATEAERFFNFYESKNWMVGKTKMSKWKAAASNWVSKNKADSHVPVITPDKPNDTRSRTIVEDLTDRRWAN